MAFPAECDPGVIQNLVATQIPQIRLQMNKNLATRTPWSNVIAGGTFEANQGYTRRIVVPNYAGVEGENRAVPTFTALSAAAACKPSTKEVTYGQTEFTTQLARYRGKSNNICVKDQFANVAGSMAQSVYAMQEYIKELYALDIRYNLTDLSGVKAVVSSAQYATGGLGGLITGGFNNVQVAYPGFLPDSRASTALLRAIRGYAFTALNVEPFGNGTDSYALVIAGDEAIRQFQNDEGDRQDYRALTTGKYVLGVDGLSAFQFVGSPFRGIAYGVDQYPLRFNAYDVNGNPVFISHRLTTPAAGDFGDSFPLNPDWVNADYEVAHMVFKNSFRRLVPSKDLAGNTGDGKIKFTPQANMGELEWHNVVDNGCNDWGDFGYFKFQITRGFEPLQPHAIIPIVFKRCPEDLGLLACES